MTHTNPPIDMHPEHWAIVRDILRTHIPHACVWAFGSRVHGRAKPFSDLDLVIVADVPLNGVIRVSLCDDLCESDLPYKVDIVDWATTSASFRQIITRNYVVIQTGSVPVADDMTQ